MKLDSPSSWLHIQTLQGAPLASSKRSVTRTVMSPPLPNGEPASAGSKSGCLAGEGSLRCAPSPRKARVGVSEKGTHLTETDHNTLINSLLVHTNHIYYAPYCKEPCVIIANHDDFYALRERDILRLEELPPAALVYERPSYIFRRFFKNRKYTFPTEEHAGRIMGGYYSQTDSLYFFENGSVICMRHAGKESGSVYFYPKDYARRHGLTPELIKGNPIYAEISVRIHAMPADYPLNLSYIVIPGAMLQLESWFFAHYPSYLVSEVTSVDFVQLRLQPSDNPKEVEPFFAIPECLCRAQHLRFDFDRWKQCFMRQNLPLAPHDCVHPFFDDEKCVAEIIMISDTAMIETFDYFPYNDSYVLTLKYGIEFKSRIEELIRTIMSNRPRIVAVPYHSVELQFTD